MMNELSTQTTQLPDTIEDLSKFVLIGREQLVAVRAAIRAIDKVGVAQSVREQKLKEAQSISEAVLDAEVKIGELMAKVPKATPNNNPYHENDSSVDLVKPKSEVIREAGLTEKQVERFQTLAANPELVEEAKAEARKNDDIVSRSAVLKKITEKKLQPLRELKNREVTEAKKRHADFEDRKTENVVSFTDIAQDREDKNTLSVEFMIRVEKVLISIFAMHISGKTDAELDDLVMSEKKVQFTLGNLMAAEKDLSAIRAALERRTENGDYTQISQATRNGTRKPTVNNRG